MFSPEGAEGTDPRVLEAEQRAAAAVAMFNRLEEERKKAAHLRLTARNPIDVPPVAPVAPPAPKPISQVPVTPAPAPEQLVRDIKGTVDHKSSLEEITKAIDNGNFNVADYLGGIDAEEGGIHGNLTKDEVEKMFQAYRYAALRNPSALVAAKSAAKGFAEGVMPMIRGPLRVGAGLAKMQIAAPGALLGNKAAQDMATRASGEIVAGAEMGFLGTADQARRAVRRAGDIVTGVAEAMKRPEGEGAEAAAAAKRLEAVGGLADAAVEMNPMMGPVASLLGKKPSQLLPQDPDKADTKAFVPKDDETQRARFWADIAMKRQLALASRGEAEGAKTLIGGGEKTAKQVIEGAGGKVNETAIGDLGTIYNPFLAMPAVANAMSKAKTPGGLVNRPVTLNRPIPPKPGNPTLGKAMEVAGSAIQTAGSSAAKQVIPGAGLGGYAFGPLGAVTAAVTPFAAKYFGRKIKEKGARIAKGEVTEPGFGSRLASAVKTHIIDPAAAGGVGAAVHPMNLGLVALAEDDQEMGHILGGTAAFGAATHLATQGTQHLGGRAHGMLMADRINQATLREEPFDPSYGKFAKTTEANQARMTPTDRAAFNILRNNIRRINVAEPDIAKIKTMPPKITAKEYVVSEDAGPNGEVYYTTNLGRKVTPSKAAEIAFDAGQPLKDVVYSVEFIADSADGVGGVNRDAGQSLGRNASGRERGVATQFRDANGGRVEVRVDSDAFSAYHESGHVFDYSRHPLVRRELHATLVKNHGAEAMEQFRRYYAELRGSGLVARLLDILQNTRDPQQRAVIEAEIRRVYETALWRPDPSMKADDPSRPHIVAESGNDRYVADDGAGNRRVVDLNEAIDIADANGQVEVSKSDGLYEAAAEQQSMMLKSRSLQGLPESSRQKIAGELASLLENIGAYKPGFEATSGRYTPLQRPGDLTSPSATPRQRSTLGLEASMEAEKGFWNDLRRSAGEQTSADPTALEVGPPGPRFYDTEGPGGTATQRIATALGDNDAPAPKPPRPADRPIVPKPVAAPAKPATKPTPKTVVRPEVIEEDKDKISVDVTKITGEEIDTVVNGLREQGVPEADVAKVEQALRARGGTVELTYASGTPEMLSPSELSRERRAERRATYEKEGGAVNEELQRIAETTRTKFTRKFVPYRIIVRSAIGADGQPTVQANILGLSPNKILQNAIILDRTVQEINANLKPGEKRIVLPFQEGGSRTGGRYNYDRLYTALEQYTENQANGFSGAGERVAKPPGFIENVPGENANFTPHKLDPQEASLINLLMGVEPPSSTKSMGRKGVQTPEGVRAVAVGEKVAPGLATVEIQPKAVSAYQLSEANAPGRGVPSPTRQTGQTGPRTTPAKPWEVSVPTKAIRKGAPATVVKKGTFKDPVSGAEFEIQEFNRLRGEITEKARKAGKTNFDLHDKLAEAFEELNNELITNVRTSPRAEGPQMSYPSETFIEAGFMPGENKAIGIKFREAQEATKARLKANVGESSQSYNDRLSDVKPYTPTSVFGQTLAGMGMKFARADRPNGDGSVVIRTPGGSDAGTAIYRLVDTGEGGVDLKVQMIKVAPLWEGKKVIGKESVASVLTRELANIATDHGASTISGEPISHRALGLRMKVLENTRTGEVTGLGELKDAGITVADAMTPEALRAKVQRMGLEEAHRDMGFYELISDLDPYRRYLPDEMEVPQWAAVKDPDTGKVYTGAMHFLAYGAAEEAGRQISFDWPEGFVTNKGNFVDRTKATELAQAAKMKLVGVGSKPGPLLSEELPTVYDSLRDIRREGNDAPVFSKEYGQDLTARVAEKIRQEAVESGASDGKARPVGEDKPGANIPTVAVDPAGVFPGDNIPGFITHRFMPTPEGHKVTTPSQSYADGIRQKGEKNKWVRQSGGASNGDRLLMVQFEPNLMYPNGPDPVSTPYYELLYSGNRKGYSKSPDFWELPQWQAVITKNLGEKVDGYYVSDMAEAKAFMEQAGYGEVAFSVMDVSAKLTEELAPHIKGEMHLGGYTDRSAIVAKNPKAKVWDRVDDFVKSKGKNYETGFDYRLFRDTSTIPRLEMSAGCRHRCSFCTVERKVTEQPFERVQEQAASFKDLNSKLVYLNDKTFGQAKVSERLPEIYQQMKAANPEFEGFIIQTTAAQMKLFKDQYLKDAGIKYIELGIETYNDTILKGLRKPANEKLIDEATDKIRRLGINLIPNIVIGFPGETAGTYGRTRAWLEANKDVISHVNTYNLAVYEGTELSKTVKAKTAADADENSFQKSFYEDAKVHEDFANWIYKYGSEQLTEKRLMPGAGKGDPTKLREETRKRLQPVGRNYTDAVRAAVPYEPTSDAGREVADAGFVLARSQSEMGEGAIKITSPQGDPVGMLIYNLHDSGGDITDPGSIAADIAYVRVEDPYRGQPLVGNTKVSSVLYRELANTALESGVTRITGGPIDPRALGARLREFENTRSEQDPVMGQRFPRPALSAEELRKRVEEQGLGPAHHKLDPYLLVSELDFERRYLPDEVTERQLKSAQDDSALERDFANEYLAGNRSLDEFPARADYEETISAEAATIPDANNVLFIGSGPVPMSAILMKERLPKARITLGDIDQSALDLGARVTKKAGYEFDTALMDAAKTKDLGRFDTIIVALEAGPTTADKKNVVNNVLNNAPEDATVLLRSSYDNAFSQVGKLPGDWEVTDTVPTWGGKGETLVVRRGDGSAESRAMPKEQKELALRHWSNIPGLKKLKPAKYGTGLMGAERSRRRDYPELWVDRTYYGMKGYQKEPGLGPIEYETVVRDNRVYDFLKDPENLYPTSTELKEAGYAPFDEPAAVTVYEKRILDAGYDGYKNTQAKVAALYVDQPVKQVTRTSKALPGETDLFGNEIVVKKYDRAKIANMSRAQLRKQYPEAIVPDNESLKIDPAILDAPLLKGVKAREKQVQKFAQKLIEFYDSVKHLPGTKAGEKWYSSFVPKLKEAFPDPVDRRVFAELLAATSPNTDPGVNFGYAADAFYRWKQGSYDHKVKTFVEGLDHVATGTWEQVYKRAVNSGWKRPVKNPDKPPTKAEFMAWWIHSQNLKPRSSGSPAALIGMHGVRVLQVLARKWLETTEGPKTRNFIMNLLGEGHEATIDVWAARTMRRLGYEGLMNRWRILPENSKTISDPDFAFSQEAFRAAADKLGIKPDALQGALWFAEKQLYADRGWGDLDLGDYVKELPRLKGIQVKAAQNLKETYTLDDRQEMMDIGDLND